MSGLFKGILSPVLSLFGGQKAPEVKAATPMPTPDDAAVQEAKRRKIAAMQERSGRASTIFTSNEDKLGG